MKHHKVAVSIFASQLIHFNKNSTLLTSNRHNSLFLSENVWERKLSTFSTSVGGKSSKKYAITLTTSSPRKSHFFVFFYQIRQQQPHFLHTSFWPSIYTSNEKMTPLFVCFFGCCLWIFFFTVPILISPSHKIFQLFKILSSFFQTVF